MRTEMTINKSNLRKMQENDDLKKLTKYEWDTLFPIGLVDHNPDWKMIFEKERQLIYSSIEPIYLNSVAHFGSSSIPGIKSKPYIDILIEVPPKFLFDSELIREFQNIGYTCLTVPNQMDNDNYMILAKGYRLNTDCDQIFHVHACQTGHPMMKQLLFKDYLLNHPHRAKAYEKLKIQLAEKFRNDRSGYRIAKSSFISETILMREKEIST